MRLLLVICAFLLAILPATAYTKPILSANEPVAINNFATKYVRIAGEVKNTKVSNNSKVVFLNFGNDADTSFSAIIYNDALKSFSLEGIDQPENYYKNKKVMIEGILQMNNGKPEMIVKFPAQIKLMQ